MKIPENNHCLGIWKKGVSLAAVILLSAALSAGWTACALQGYSDGRLSVVSEPGADSSYVQYYAGQTQKKAADMTWVDNGHSGKALSLSGAGDYVKIGYTQLRMHTMTVSGWFYWRGAAEGQEPDSCFQQRLFTMSNTDDIWLSVMPRAKDASRTDDNGNTMDGIYMGFSYKNNHIDCWNPAKTGKESYGLPLNEWHHVAMTMDGQSLKLYIDGTLWFDKMLILGVEEMRNDSLTIGSGRWDGPTLNALVDDIAVYSFALSADQIAMLNAGVDPLAEGASVPAKTQPSLPTEPSKAQTVSDTVPSQESDGTLFGLPVWSLWIMGIILFGFIGLSVLFSVYQPEASAKTSVKTPPQKAAHVKENPKKGGEKS